MEKKFSDLKLFSLILAENPLIFPDFPDWKKSTKFSLIGGKPVYSQSGGTVCIKLTWLHSRLVQNQMSAVR